jgi:hypothetical protein
MLPPVQLQNYRSCGISHAIELFAEAHSRSAQETRRSVHRQTEPRSDGGVVAVFRVRNESIAITQRQRPYCLTNQADALAADHDILRSRHRRWPEAIDIGRGAARVFATPACVVDRYAARNSPQPRLEVSRNAAAHRSRKRLLNRIVRVFGGHPRDACAHSSERRPKYFVGRDHHRQRTPASH